MNADEHRFAALAERIIACAYRVSNGLGCGLLEKPYENALVHELRKSGLSVQQQVPMPVRYDGVVVGEYIADVVVEGTVLVEVKAVKGIDDIHVAQSLNYLAIAHLPVGLVLNFAKPRLEIRRVVR